MAYQVLDPVYALQAIEDTSTVQRYPLGTIVKASDPVLGYGAVEFEYVKGVASGTLGDMVIFDHFAGTTTRAVAGSRGPAGVLMAALSATTLFGWAAVNGVVPARSATAAAGASVYVTASAGQIDDAVVATDKIDGARYKTADGTPSAGLAILMLARPCLNGNG